MFVVNDRHNNTAATQDNDHNKMQFNDCSLIITGSAVATALC